MLNIAQRNLKIFFRQKGVVFFSLLGVFIIILLYLVFLGDVWATDFELPNKDVLLHEWLIAGIVSVASVTTAMGAFQILVEDRANKNSKDFFSAPVSRTKIVGGYILSAYAVGVIMSTLSFVLGEIYIVLSGGSLLEPPAMLQVLGIILLSALASSALVFFIVSFFSSDAAFATASTVIGTLIGFLTGVYLPVGTLPEGVQWVVKLFPVSHSGALLRQVMMESTLQTSFAGLPARFAEEFKQTVGVVYTFGDFTATPLVHILVLLGTAAVFFLLALWNVSRKSKKS